MEHFHERPLSVTLSSVINIHSFGGRNACLARGGGGNVFLSFGHPGGRNSFTYIILYYIIYFSSVGMLIGREEQTATSAMVPSTARLRREQVKYLKAKSLVQRGVPEKTPFFP